MHKPFRPSSDKSRITGFGSAISGPILKWEAARSSKCSNMLVVLVLSPWYVRLDILQVILGANKPPVQTLVPYVTKILGLDLSDNMVNEYNKNAEQNGYSNKMSARTGDLLTDPVPTELSGPEYFGFDVVVISMALHHFDDAGKALRYLGDRLKTGGTCIIIDNVPDHLSDHHHNHVLGEAAHTVKTHGFTMEQMRDLFTNAGMEANFGYQVLDEPAVFQMNGKSFSKTLFLARAQRT